MTTSKWKTNLSRIVGLIVTLWALYDIFRRHHILGF